MKVIFRYILPALFLLVLLDACQKVNVNITTELTPSVFPQNTQQFIEASGPPYAALRGNFALDYWFMQTLSTDEAILPARGGNWYDPASGYNNLHYHNWNASTGWPNTCWTWLSTVIGASNQALSILNTTEPDSLSTKPSNLAEIKIVRDLAYFFMMDLYGNIPIDTTYGDFIPHANLPRAQVFSWLEGDIKACLPYLSMQAGTLYYGRANKYTAYALLAKMYLNAQYYTGTDRSSDCVWACDSVINAGGGSQYAVQPMSSYLQMFYPTNGPTTQTEFIFAIPYDPTAGIYPGTNGLLYRARYDLDRNLGIKYGYAGATPGNVIDPVIGQSYPGSGLINESPSGPESTLFSFYSAAFTDPNDVRNGQWLTGLQYNKDGTPLLIQTTKGGTEGYNAGYTASDANTIIDYQLNLTPDIVFRPNIGNPALFDLGNDDIAWDMGYRNIKFLCDYTNPSNRDQNNDVPVFRYSDILLMKAEAILRGAAPTQGQTALSLVNKLRAGRTTSAPWSSVTLDSIYNERCREFTWETWHRNDMIRFGKYEGAWGFKTDADPDHRIFPIPNNALLLNPALKQNAGY